MAIEVDFQLASDASSIPSAEDFSHWAAAAIESNRSNAELTIRIVDSEESQQLNATYRGKDKPTNVLSFPFEAPPGIELPLIGDLVICAPVVTREAQEQAKIERNHWAHMVIHGCLHLLGYDHIKDDEAVQMEALEIKLLASIDIPNPYETE